MLKYKIFIYLFIINLSITNCNTNPVNKLQPNKKINHIKKTKYPKSNYKKSNNSFCNKIGSFVNNTKTILLTLLGFSSLNFASSTPNNWLKQNVDSLIQYAWDLNTFEDEFGIFGTRNDVDGMLNMYDYDGKFKWNFMIDNGKIDKINILEKIDDDFFAMGNSEFDDIYNIFYSRLNNTGGHKYTKRLGGNYYTRIHSLIKNNKGNYVGTGETKYSGPNRELLGFEFDSNLTILWINSYGGITSDIGYSIAETDNRYVFFGENTNFGIGIDSILVFSTFKNGTYTRGKVIGETEYDNGISLKRLSNNNLIGIAYITGSQNYHKLLILIFDENSKLLDAKLLEDLHFRPYNILVKSDNEIYIVGTSAIDTTKSNKVILKTNSQIKKVTAIIFENTESQKYDIISGIKLSPDEYLITSGFSFYYDSNSTYGKFDELFDINCVNITDYNLTDVTSTIHNQNVTLNTTTNLPYTFVDHTPNNIYSISLDQELICHSPTNSPTNPSMNPTTYPSLQPSIYPTIYPSLQPSINPIFNPNPNHTSKVIESNEGSISDNFNTTIDIDNKFNIINKKDFIFNLIIIISVLLLLSCCILALFILYKKIKKIKIAKEKEKEKEYRKSEYRKSEKRKLELNNNDLEPKPDNNLNMIELQNKKAKVNNIHGHENAELINNINILKTDNIEGNKTRDINMKEDEFEIKNDDFDIEGGINSDTNNQSIEIFTSRASIENVNNNINIQDQNEFEIEDSKQNIITSQHLINGNILNKHNKNESNNSIISTIKDEQNDNQLNEEEFIIEDDNQLNEGEFIIEDNNEIITNLGNNNQFTNDLIDINEYDQNNEEEQENEYEDDSHQMDNIQTIV